MGIKRQPPPGTRQVGLDLPLDLIDAVITLAEANGRRIRDEVIHALQRHLAAPPVVRVETPDMPPAEVVAPPKKPGGRPPKRSKT